MDIESPSTIEVPIRVLDVQFASGKGDSVTLKGDGTRPGDDLLSLRDDQIIVSADKETITYLKGGHGVVAWRVLTTTMKRRAAHAGMPVAGTSPVGV